MSTTAIGTMAGASTGIALAILAEAAEIDTATVST